MRTPTTDTDLWNADLAPTSAAQRTWRWYHFAALWVGMVMCIPAYTLSASLIEGGMSAWQAVVTVFLANAIVLLPMLLIGHAGTKYGIPYAVLARASFGTRGARLPALMRAIVACGWYGIQTWFGGSMIYTLLGVMAGRPIGGAKDRAGPGHQCRPAGLLPGLLGDPVLFHRARHGFDPQARDLDRAAEDRDLLRAAGWVYHKAGGFGPLLDQPSAVRRRRQEGRPVLARVLAFADGHGRLLGHAGAEHPDFTRFAKTQRDQVLGQSLGLPVPMGLLAALAVIVTSATVVLYGKALWDPVDVASRMTGIAVLIALLVLLIDTVSVNLAANLVGPAYDFSALAPKHHLLPRGRLHHGRHRAGHDALEDPGIDPGLYLHLADRLFGAAGAHRRHPDHRLLLHPQDRARGRPAVPRRRHLFVRQAAGTRPPSSPSWPACCRTSRAS
jgi:NCS1 family nucleobase:cation symporter-1